MDKETLKKANELSNLIEELKKALLCFEYDENEIPNSWKNEGEKLPPKMVSTNPKLIIEYDEWDEDMYRHQQPIPIVLSDFLIDVIKQHIETNLKNLKQEFKNL